LPRPHGWLLSAEMSAAAGFGHAAGNPIALAANPCWFGVVRVAEWQTR
jgi:hypothetical protein